jgi:GNAT superfamily N-acetyltransferase
VSSVADTALAHALEFQRATLELVVERFEPIEPGWVVREPSVPLVWSANHVRIAHPVGFAEALALADAHLGDLPYRQLMVEHEGAGRALEGQFAGAGWEVDRDLLMELAAEPDRPADTGLVIEADEDPVMALMRRWIGEDETIELTPSGLDQVVEFTRLTARARGARLLGVPGEHGTLAGITMLFSDGVVAQVEDVYVVPEERGRGYARAMVMRATELAREAGHEFVFIVADADGWPRQLYRQVGFRPIGYGWSFHRGG